MTNRWPRENEFWGPELLWRGQTAFLLGGGPSLRGFDTCRLAGHGRVVAINSSFLIAPKADLLYFTDDGWFETHRHIVETWPGLVITAGRRSKGKLPDKILRAQFLTGQPVGPGVWPLRNGPSSGHTVVGTVAALGASRIVLLGYDGRCDAGRSHHHDDYQTGDPTLYERDFVPAWKGWAAAAAGRVEILNATPASAINEFPRVDLEELLT